MTHGGGDGPDDGLIIEFPTSLRPLPPLPTEAPVAPLDTSIGPGHTEWVDMEEWEPPISNHLSPFGQVEHFGAALRSGVRHPGWKRTAVKVWAWSMLLAGPVLSLLVWLLG